MFLHKRNFFGMVPKGLNAFGSFVYAAESASLHFELLGSSQNGVFSTLSTKSQTFYTINFFSDSTEGFALLFGECAALRRQIA